MDPKKRRVLQKFTVELTRDMNPEDMKRVLFAKQMLTQDELDRLSLPIMTRRDKNLFILQKIPSKGSRAFDFFIDCLQTTADENPVHQDLVETMMRELQEMPDE